MNLTQIAKGWYHYLKANKATQELMMSRLKVCENCAHRREVNGLGKMIFDGSPNNLHKCGICNCPLGVLASTPKPGCKLNKWEL